MDRQRRREADCLIALYLFWNLYDLLFPNYVLTSLIAVRFPCFVLIQNKNFLKKIYIYLYRRQWNAYNIFSIVNATFQVSTFYYVLNLRRKLYKIIDSVRNFCFVINQFFSPEKFCEDGFLSFLNKLKKKNETLILLTSSGLLKCNSCK